MYVRGGGGGGDGVCVCVCVGRGVTALELVVGALGAKLVGLVVLHLKM